MCSGVHHPPVARRCAGSKRHSNAGSSQSLPPVTTGEGDPSLRSQRVAHSPDAERAARRLSPPTVDACGSPRVMLAYRDRSSATGYPARRMPRVHRHAAGGAGQRAPACRLSLRHGSSTIRHSASARNRPADPKSGMGPHPRGFQLRPSACHPSFTPPEENGKWEMGKFGNAGVDMGVGVMME